MAFVLWSPATMRARPRLLLALMLGVGAVGLCAWLVERYGRGAVFLARAAGLKGWAERIARAEIGRVSERSLTVPWRGGELAARLFQPEGRAERAILLAPGVH